MKFRINIIRFLPLLAFCMPEFVAAQAVKHKLLPEKRVQQAEDVWRCREDFKQKRPVDVLLEQEIASMVCKLGHMKKSKKVSDALAKLMPCLKHDYQFEPEVGNDSCEVGAALRCDLKEGLIKVLEKKDFIDPSVMEKITELTLADLCPCSPTSSLTVSGSASSSDMHQ